MKTCETKPCLTCPWRKSNPKDGSTIPNFKMKLMRKLSNTVPPRGSEQDGFYGLMSCHHSREGKDFVCAGYLFVEGYNNINARMLMSRLNLDAEKFYRNCDQLELYSSFYAMLDDYEITHQLQELTNGR